MFDNLLRRRFTKKCKHATKCISMRIATIRKKKQAMLRFLRKDVADLIANGLDVNAFGRIEALITGTNHVSCYDMLQQYCEYITIQLPVLQKQRECPQEAMEAVATLIYAAARFSDLPELCDLRRLFTERYGSHMESLVNSEFVEKIQKKSFSVDKKLHMMQEITQEFSVTWDCKAFQQKMSNPPASVTDQTKKGTPICNQNNEPRLASNMRKGADVDIENEEIPYNGNFEATPRSVLQKQVQPEPRDIHVVSSIKNGRKVIDYEPEIVDPFSKNAVVPPYSERNGSRKGSHKDDQLKEGIVHKRSPSVNDDPGLVGIANEVVGADRAHFLVPPYTKPKGNKTETRGEDHHENRHPYDRSPRAAEGSVDPGGQERQPVRQVNSSNKSPFNLAPPPYYKPKLNNLPSNGSSNGGEHKDHRKDEPTGDEKPKPVSVRRRHMKLQTLSKNGSNVDDDKLVNQTPTVRRRHGERQIAYDDDYTERETRRDQEQFPKQPVKEEVGIDKHVNRTSSGQRRHESSRKTGATYDEDSGEDGERVMDQLLVHYSKKGTDNEIGITRTRKGALTAEIDIGGGKFVEHHTGGKVYPEAMKSVLPQRAASFPVEPISTAEVVKGHARAVSMQPEILSPGVHPRLPDYDDLAARFRALKKA